LAVAGLLTPLAGAHADPADAIRTPISDLYAALEAQMRAGPAQPFRQRFHTLAPVIERVFDLDAILRASVGLRWSSLDAHARSALTEAFRRFTIASYVASFDKSDHEKFDILPELRESAGNQIVQTRIIDAKGEAVRLDYVMRTEGTTWRVIDVLLDGTISRVAVQRSDFRGLLADGDASALVASLEQKIADLSGGTLA
jgi:phospholipid transport system substrate-binding protein